MKGNPPIPLKYYIITVCVSWKVSLFIFPSFQLSIDILTVITRLVLSLLLVRFVVFTYHLVRVYLFGNDNKTEESDYIIEQKLQALFGIEARESLTNVTNDLGVVKL